MTKARLHLNAAGPSICYSICVFCLKGRGKRHNTGGERRAERSREWLWPLCREKQYDKIKKQVTRGEGGLHENHIPIFPRSFQ